MAAITITRPLSDQGSGTEYNIISAFMPATFEFTFERGTASGTYAEVVFSGYTFRATMIQANYATNTDLYLMDLTSILPYWLGFPPMIETTTGLSKDLSVVINGKSSAGATLATATHTTQKVIYAYGDIREENICDRIYYLGRKFEQKLYNNNGYISFYFNGANGNYQINLGGISYTYALVNGWNSILLWYTHYNLSGQLTITGQSTTFYVQYCELPVGHTSLISWLNDNGCWSKHTFLKLSTNNIVESDVNVPVFSKSNYDTVAKSVEIKRTRKVQLTFMTIAYNADHFGQLCRISESQRVFFGNPAVAYKVVSAPTSVAECRQNLNFVLTLEREDNVVSY